MTRWILACGLVLPALGAHAAEAFPNRPISIIFKKFFDDDHQRMAVAIQRIGKVDAKK